MVHPPFYYFIDYQVVKTFTYYKSESISLINSCLDANFSQLTFDKQKP